MLSGSHRDEFKLERTPIFSDVRAQVSGFVYDISVWEGSIFILNLSEGREASLSILVEEVEVTHGVRGGVREAKTFLLDLQGWFRPVSAFGKTPASYYLSLLIEYILLLI